MAARAGATEAAALLIKHGADIRTLGRASRDAPVGAERRFVRSLARADARRRRQSRDARAAGRLARARRLRAHAARSRTRLGSAGRCVAHRWRARDDAFGAAPTLLACAAALRGADGKRVVALLAAHPTLVRFADSTGKNILHVRGRETTCVWSRSRRSRHSFSAASRTRRRCAPCSTCRAAAR